MAIHNEVQFELDICQHLAANGWLLSNDDQGYDRESALIPGDVLAWIQESQPGVWERLQKSLGAQAEKHLIARLAKVLDERGTLDVLRKGFDMAGAGATSVQMLQPRPPSDFNAEIAKRYASTRLRVMRQVHYSTSGNESIDLVLFCNGLPVATLELKTDFTQSVEDAKAQYRNDRTPRHRTTNKPEPLLTFKRGALVHFAVSTSEVSMTTKLNGPDTFFLPFNKGFRGGAGNPPCENGYATAYLWTEVLRRDMWIRVLSDFIQMETKKERTDKGTATKHRLIFPRLHQLQATVAIVDACRREGPGNKYLIQHSAGSGKSNTISWCAHQLSTLYGPDDKKVFDSVIVVTDRTVLDAQLQDNVKQFGQVAGVVQTIRNDAGSKSAQLEAAIRKNALIIVVTIQTFPFILAGIRDDKNLKGRRYCVIVDEAHSSQNGATARNMRGALADSDEETANEGNVEDFLIKEAAGRKLPSNVSVLAFTATPKAKTLEVFGRISPGSDKPQPFHLYSMRQAIEEGFILDVLRNYTPYKVAYKLGAEAAQRVNREVDKKKARRAIARFVELHPHNVAQKVDVILSHFRQNVMHLLDGKAKAMIVTGSRQMAVRYKLEVDRQIKAAGYTDMAALVAFSGEVVDPESGPDKFTESGMNQLKHGDIRSAFDTDSYQVLIVANKFQTGFDQPLLCAMYVDKKLDGIAAVQTLSRLNRTHPGKDTTFVLDFVNKTEDIRAAFEPYYEESELIDTTDPNLVYDLKMRLDGYGLYNDADIERVVGVFYRKRSTQKDLVAALAAPVDRFKVKWREAEEKEDKEAQDGLRNFSKNLVSYCRLYDFISQVVDYGDARLEAFYIFARYLEPLVRPEMLHVDVDLSGVVLSHYKLKEGASTSIVLGDGDEDERGIKPVRAVGSAESRDPEKIRLAELLEQLNSLFDDNELTDDDRVGLFRHVASKILDNESIRAQAEVNTLGQLGESATLKQVVAQSVIAAMGSYQTMGRKVLSDEKAMSAFTSMLVDHVWHAVREDGGMSPHYD